MQKLTQLLTSKNSTLTNSKAAKGTTVPFVNGSYKNELIHTRRWDDVVEVEIATFEWVSWWNEDRLHQSLGYRTPVEGRNRILEEEAATGNNRNQGKCLGKNSGHFSGYPQKSTLVAVFDSV